MREPAACGMVWAVGQQEKNSYAHGYCGDSFQNEDPAPSFKACCACARSLAIVSRVFEIRLPFIFAMAAANSPENAPLAADAQ